jgi:hypothetical protein
MKTLLLALVSLALPLAAQEQKQEPARVQKIFVLKYADPRQVRDTVVAFGPSNANTELHTLTVTATPESMKAIEDAIARLDTPAAAPRDIDLTFYLVVGGEGDLAAARPFPKDLDSVVTQLKNAFAFKSYRLLDTLTLRTRTGQNAAVNSAGGIMEAGSASPPVLTSIVLNAVSIAPDGTIQINRMRAGIKMPVMSGAQWTYTDLGINSDLGVKDGQKVVVGRIGISRDQALFLVVMARPSA